mmetsp:Transcript_41449/g.99842  ORF Transcript_41449/g.99842 Transcript_41449/m.99842 type:complete len:152 (-) Transcript_41449:519-974(-)
MMYHLVFSMGWVILAMLVILFSMVSFYLFVRKTERRAARWSQHASDGRQQKRVLTKSIAIIAAYFLTWTPTIFAVTPVLAHVDAKTVDTIVAAILPLQGFFNALIFSGCAEQCLDRLCFGKKSPEEAPPRTSAGGKGPKSFSASFGGALAT